MPITARWGDHVLDHPLQAALEKLLVQILLKPKAYQGSCKTPTQDASVCRRQSLCVCILQAALEKLLMTLCLTPLKGKGVRFPEDASGCQGQSH